MKTIKNLFKTRKLRFHQNCKKQIENPTEIKEMDIQEQININNLSQ
jgi:hypothetical protein